MSKAQQTFAEICTRLGITESNAVDFMSAELVAFLNYPTDAKCPPMRPALVAQVAKFTGTSPAAWVEMEGSTLLDDVAKIDVDHITTFKPIHLPLRHKGCLFCGSDAISYFRTLNYKQCLCCGEQEVFKLRDDQEPLLGSSRNLKRGDS